MVACIIGNYLRDIGLLTEEQLHDLLAEHRKIHAQLGIIAVAEGLMSHDEAERVNRLQAVMDMRFGDIAVEEGYLTEGQVDTLLKKQGNAYLAFAQALENQQLMLIEQLEQILIDFQYDNNFTNSDMEVLKGDDIDQILTLYLPFAGERYRDIASASLRTMMRLVDVDVCIGKAYLTNRREIQNGSIQRVEGKDNFTTGLVSWGNALKEAASVFGQEAFNKVDEDALDAIGELLNCINGLIVSDMSRSGKEMELCPPEYSIDSEAVISGEMLVLPLRLVGQKVDFVVAIGKKLEIQ